SNVAGYSHLTVEVLGPFSATFTFYGSNDGANYYPITAVSLSNPTAAPSSAWSVPGLYCVPVNFSFFQIVVSAYASGMLSFVTESHASPSSTLVMPALPLPSNAAQETGGSLATLVTLEENGGCKTQIVDPTSYAPVNIT